MPTFTSALSRRALRVAHHRRVRRRLAVAGAIAAGIAFGGLAATGAAAAAEALPLSGDPSGATTLQSVAVEAAATVDEAHAAIAGAEAISTEIAQSGLDLGGEATEVDTSDLQAAVERLSGFEVMPLLLVPDVVDETAEHIETVTTRVADLRSRLDAAQAQKAAEEAAAAAAAAEAAAIAAGNTVEGAKATAAELAATQYGWGSDQFQCLDSLWTKESDWNYQAVNPSSGATGIPQSLPGHKMATAGADWQTNATTQIRWGLDYIFRAYGTPCAAWAHSQATDWY
ncbi:phospholipase [Microbacterium sp. Sa4CUA7]|uniref:Phospholipase n=1 Tax=Microbacterium pullorum TaxID=2762236 RepID=A0ABR8RXS7_9MICO|nr:phospholipase [Microbacterium pullorum]MBD7956042.1 phospholipase [Microbacterium pullorum]